jgi:hypothetical protein
MAGFVPTEGLALIANMVCKHVLTDRDADLELGLFTNSDADGTLTEATVTEPTGTGYARKDLTDASWTGAAEARAYAKQTFTGGAGGWSGSVYGYFIATKASGGTPRLLFVEIDPAGPYTINENDTYDVTPNVTVANA